VYGLRFRNSHSYINFGLTMLSKKRIVLPESADEYIDIPGRDGSILFPGALKDRIEEIEFTMPSNTLPELRKLSRRVAAWLYSPMWEALIFDDEPDLYYMAKVANQLDLEQTVAVGRFSVQFRYNPVALSITGDAWQQAVSAGTTYIITNNGTYKALPVITITASSQITGFSLTVEDKTLAYAGTLEAGQNLVIDCQKYQATKAGASAMKDISGNFPVLYTGDNDVSINKNCTLNITWRKRWL